MIGTTPALRILLIKIPTDQIKIALDLRESEAKKRKYRRDYMQFIFSFNMSEEVPEVPPV